MSMEKLSNICNEQSYKLIYQEVALLQNCYTQVLIICNTFVTGLFVGMKG